MRSMTTLVGLFLLAGSPAAFSAGAADKPVIVAMAHVKKAEAKTSHAATPVVLVTHETAVPEGSLEKFGSVGLPQ